jgi:hypothetical protein
MSTSKLAVLAGLIGMALSGGAFAAVSAAEAGKLGKELTLMGSEKAGNADKTIPAYEGGITKPPAGYSVGTPHIDPFADDKPLFTITPQNVKDYAAKLSPGQQAMFAKYADYKMMVYPSRRSASFPQRTLEYTVKNATACKLIANGDGVSPECAEGFPFPVTSDPYELIWNHKLKYKGIAILRRGNQVAPTESGAYSVVRLREELLGLYYKPGNTVGNINNILVYFFQEVEGPARLAGNVLLVHETLNAQAQPRQAWVYNPGQRRVRRAPNVAYDNPGTASDGLRTNDMTDMFNGAMDRFDWKLVGKKEMYIPYNCYAADSSATKVSQLVKPGHINPDFIRYELHRVWVIEATLKAGQRHINSRRTFYLDEDSWQIVGIDHYDGQKQLWRYSEALPINYYEVPTLWTTLETHYDLKTGRYISGLLDNQDKPRDFSFQSTPADYSPQNLRDSGIR